MARGQLLTRTSGVQRGTEADNSRHSNTQLSYQKFYIYNLNFRFTISRYNFVAKLNNGRLDYLVELFGQELSWWWGVLYM